MATKLTIGGETYVIEPLSFNRLKAAWPALDATLNSEDLRFGDANVLTAFAAVLLPDHPELAEGASDAQRTDVEQAAHALGERLVGLELRGLIGGFAPFLTENGLLQPGSTASGEAEAAGH